MTNLRKKVTALVMCLALGLTMIGSACNNANNTDNINNSTNSDVASESIAGGDKTSDNEKYEPEDNGNGIFEWGEKMADFTITTSDGETFNLYEKLQEKDMVVLNFWATWCTPCKMEMPTFNKIYGEYQDKIAMLAISVEPNDTDSVLTKFKQNNNILFDMANDSIGLLNDFAVTAVPVTIVIDRFGVITFKHVGALINETTLRGLFDTFCGDDYTDSELVYQIDDGF